MSRAPFYCCPAAAAVAVTAAAAGVGGVGMVWWWYGGVVVIGPNDGVTVIWVPSFENLLTIVINNIKTTNNRKKTLT